MPKTNPDSVIKVSIPVTFEIPMARVPAELKKRAKAMVRSTGQQVRFEITEYIETTVGAAVRDWLTDNAPDSQPPLTASAK